jgi:hypothetical protein
MPALALQKRITFGEMRATGVRGILVYCSDYHCSHWVKLAAGRWPGQVRLSDIEDSFVHGMRPPRRRHSAELATTEPAAVGSVFWPCGVIQPVPGLFIGPTGNSVALGDSNTLTRAQLALGRFGAMHRRGAGRSTQSDQ